MNLKISNKKMDVGALPAEEAGDSITYRDAYERKEIIEKFQQLSDSIGKMESIKIRHNIRKKMNEVKEYCDGVIKDPDCYFDDLRLPF